MATVTSVQAGTVLSENSSSPFSVTYPVGVTLGNLLAVCFQEGNNVTIVPPSGWSQAGAFEGIASNVGAAIFYAVVTAGMAGATSFSFTFTGGTGHTSGAVPREWNSSTGWSSAGVSGTPLDQTAGATGTTATVATGPTAAATAQAQELAIACLAYGSTALTESGLTAGYTQGLESINSSGPDTGREAYAVLSAAGVQACQMTISSAANWAAVLATFMPAADGSNSGPNSPSAGAGLTGGTGSWANPGNITAADGAVASWAVV